MTSIHAQFEGGMKSSATHDDSGFTLMTNAPTDIGGDGSSFSPTDLVAGALGTCIGTTMGMFAKRHEIDLTGLKIHVIKEMSTDTPRRISSLQTTVTVPAGRIPLDQRETYERVGRSCPVHKSLHPDINAPIDFVYED